MKRLPMRELALMCAPIALLAGAFLIPLIRRPPKDPNAVIVLSLSSRPSTLGLRPNSDVLSFAWEAKAVGGPKYGYRFGFRQKIVAVLKNGEKELFVQPGKLTANSMSSSSNGNYTPGESASMSSALQLNGGAVPVTAKRLEWRGEVVAFPIEEDTFGHGQMSAAQIAKWAKTKGAARVVRTFPIKFDASKNAIRECVLEPVNATNASRGADTCVTTEVRRQARRTCRRLVAFDGKTTRLLWEDQSDGRNRYCQGSQTIGSAEWERESVLFRLRDVPREWGEIAWFYDVVFVDEKPDHDHQNATLQTLSALERVGGLRVSRRIVVRAKGTTVAAPAFQKTPNLQFQNFQVQRFPTAVQINVALLYTGKLVQPEVDVPGGVDFFDEQGDHVHGLNPSFGVKRGANAREWKLEIVLRAPQKAPRKMRMEVEVADGEAAPLRIERDVVLPR